MKRRQTKTIYKGNVAVGGNNPISVQSMTNTLTCDIKTTIEQILCLEKAGCEIIRVAVPDEDSANALSEIRKAINIPLIADIHFNYKLALKALEQNIDGIRINPGNIKDKNKVKEIVSSAKHKAKPIRIGLNSGSVERKTGNVVQDMVNSASEYISWFCSWNFENIIVSLKASNVLDTISAYKKMSLLCDYPFHLGVTSAGTLRSGTVQSAIGIGALLLDGIGDTIRVSLTHNPIEEVKTGYEILSSLGLKEQKGVKIVSCPTCGRCSVDLIEIVNNIEKKLENFDKNMTIAVMGCVVNGPGEAQDVDLGIAWGSENNALLFKKGEEIRKIEGKTEEIIEEFLKEIC